MAVPEITVVPIPTGGAISLAISGAVSGAVLLERAVSGVGTFTTIYSGVATQYYLDIGDGLPAPLDANLFYQYRYTDPGGSTTTDFYQPVSLLAVEPEPISQVLIRLIQGTLNSTPLPPGVKNAQVTQAMPLGGAIPMPLVVVNLDLFQQANVPIGQSTNVFAAILSAASGVPVSGYTTLGFAKRLFRVSVLATDAITRDFYRDLLVGFFEAIYASVLQPIGVDVTHRWQASSGQVAHDKTTNVPGFYFADVTFEFEGILNVVLNLTHPLIQTITTQTSGAQPGTINEIVIDETVTPPGVFPT